MASLPTSIVYNALGNWEGYFMSKMLSSAAVHNDRSGAFMQRCKSAEVSFAEKSKAGDLADIEIDACDDLAACGALHDKLLDGRLDVQSGRVRPAYEVLADLRASLG